MQSRLADRTQYLVSELRHNRIARYRDKSLRCIAEEIGVPFSWFTNVYYGRTDLRASNVVNVERLYNALSPKELTL